MKDGFTNHREFKKPCSHGEFKLTALKNVLLPHACEVRVKTCEDYHEIVLNHGRIPNKKIIPLPAQEDFFQFLGAGSYGHLVRLIEVLLNAFAQMIVTRAFSNPCQITGPGG